jgi:NAD(P)-dependent dehydrogenase (short-subunit alcohol dehydrogenase family)
MPTVFITGANRGLGLEFARQYSNEGWRVIATCRDAAAEDLRGLVGAVEIFPLDVTDRAAAQALAAELSGTSIDVLLNNAGVLLDYHARLGEIDHDALATSFAINALAPLHICESFADHVAASDMKVMASISSHLGSIDGIGAGSGYSYPASKAALNALMKNVAGDVAGRGIKVVLFHPGWVRTAMGGPSAAVDPGDSAAGMRRIIAELTAEQSGCFVTYQGDALPW